MRFKTGSKVEVLNMRESPYGSWWSAEIISGNGHYYNVIYDICPPHMGSNIVERVPRKSLRPCPPVQCSRSWVSGDIVEVYHSGSWGHSVVARVVDSDHYFVRLFGTSQAFKVHSSSLRPRQSWQDPNWVEIRKDCRNSDGVRWSKDGCKQRLTCQMLDQGINFPNNIEDDHIPSVNSTNLLEPHATMSRGVKRWSEFCLSLAEGNTQSTRKIRAVGKDDMCHRRAAGHSSRLFDKVDAVASPPIVLGEIYMHTPHNRTGYSEFYRGEKPNADVECLITRRLESYNAKNDASSVCSSTGSNSLDMLGGLNLDLDGFTEDASTLGVSKYVEGESNPKKVDVDAEIHKVELHAYRSTMGVLYASGPLSWEQEALMTNLRLMLHISNDEHLSELRHLKSLS